uniref:Prolyl 4-hydroxylase alpha subunit Fe(2+) 2OG dioxygenase domain-containing protein n=1 Tax=Corethron hystrix TaxID=216773 RepID=A0A7S1BG62_9STRA|mmetsp:Transcript_26819/g.61738  ORF Transcript_26819/g.61738 Transcript_26819/m.61738 type:complete len:235 (+) Transcript_26819:126-830(+)|eukprot:CAMPEP_0113310476 /NCGR_PEP_ID=MMETSP0010_2-20120614/8107_1 /TAXON_ID=216773 ORGANISM="Corethron hystrix, Strain 308" /NCGR_SAMPLE_ID=MMETSP0010_2 /ASSEMBLY_ACC=CAM_ASM_000155 /LENGTH=234 /DNA_ID=CAMNT_0000165941 /DNA_START=112 /DNA_END=816 /DNA_ORIENTATION=- /assembly_acc=CAM_ASM_000155
MTKIKKSNEHKSRFDEVEDNNFIPALLVMIVAVLAFFLFRELEREEKANRPRHNTTIVDQFITNENILEKLQNRTLWEACDDSSGGWWDKNSPPTNIWEEISAQIWKIRPEYYESSEGFEWWCNILDGRRPLSWHIDKDEKELRLNNRLVHPIMGAVYYGYKHMFEGGLLQTVDAGAYDNPKELIEWGEVQEIAANFNRLVVFNASLWHGVSEIRKGERFALAVNAWEKKPSGY